MARPTYQALIEKLRASSVVVPDETGWKIGGWLEWLWVFVGEDVTVYAIQSGRGFSQAAAILGADFAGVMVRDGWAPYRRFEKARHQTCLGHLLARCKENSRRPCVERHGSPGRSSACSSRPSSCATGGMPAPSTSRVWRWPAVVSRPR